MPFPRKKSAHTKYLKIGANRFQKSVRRARARKLLKSKFTGFELRKLGESKGIEKYFKFVKSWSPINLRYLLNEKDSFLNFDRLQIYNTRKGGNVHVPERFSIIDNSEESYNFIKEICSNVIFQRYQYIYIDYSKCQHADLSAQILLDVILADLVKLINKADTIPTIKQYLVVKEIRGGRAKNPDVRKMLKSVGTPNAILNIKNDFPDIIPYRLCKHDRDSNADYEKRIERKEIDTSDMVDYVLKCLDRFGKTLTPEGVHNLSTVVGEILINAEEHSTTKYRFSIGYFQEIEAVDDRYGVFRLVIFNFGKTIYEKFNDPFCQRQDIVGRMRILSEKYTRRGLFTFKTFTEENLWTLYALQEGVTSVPNQKRGNGCIQFIDSFFNLKGGDNQKVNSQLTILSGKTNITFDGKYRIETVYQDGQPFKVMAFNRTGSLEDKPDDKYVKSVDYFFPGTVIAAKIVIDKNSLEYGATSD